MHQGCMIMKKLTFFFACLLLSSGVFAQSTTWKKNATGYWVWLNNKPQNNTISTLLDDDLLVYDSLSTSTFVLPGFRIAKYDSVYQGLLVGSGKDTYYWRTKDKLYWLYKNGIRITANRAVWVEENMFAYDTISGESMLFRNYLNAPANKVFPAELLGRATSSYWRTNGSSYWLYQKGNYIGSTRSFWLGDDLVVYDTIGNRSYQFMNYKTASINKIYPAPEVQSQSHIFFFQNGSSYWLYDKGKPINNGKSYWHQNDLLVYHEPSNKTYLMPNYVNNVGIKLNTAEVLSTTDHVWWFGDPDSYWLYDRGEQVTESSWKSEGKNLILTGANGKVYVLKDFYTNKDMILRPVMMRN